MRRIPNMRLADGFKLEYMPSVATTVLKGLPLVWDKN
nr:cytochrome P450 [Pseudomonas putida]